MIQTQAGFEPTTPMDHINHKKILVVRGIEPQISGWESKTLPLSYEGLLYNLGKKTIQTNIPMIQF